MNWFQDLRVFHKIMLILVVYLIAALINVVIGRNALLETQSHLIQLEEKIYDMVQLSTINKPLLSRADELLTQAVSFEENDMLTQGQASIDALLANLSKLKELDAERVDQIAQIEQAALAYQNVAVPIVKGMLDGTADFANMASDIAKKTEMFERANAGLEGYHQAIDAQFKTEILAAVDSGENSLIVTIAVSTGFAMFLGVLIFYIARTISSTASQISDSLHELSQGSGELAHRVSVTGKDELGSTALNFNSFMDKLSVIVSSIIQTSKPLLETANDLDNNAQTVKVAKSELVLKAGEGKSAMEEITLSIGEISQSATTASDAMKDTEDKANEGLDIVNNTISNTESLNTQIIEASTLVEQLAQDTKNVANILDVISSIAEQTNLLALNAAIEAARAGEQGRGFAVVADEVRALASKTGDATTEIRDVLSRLESAASSTVDAMQQAKDQSQHTEDLAGDTGAALRNIKERIEDVRSMNMTIAAATEEQSLVVANVSEIITDMHTSVESTQVAYDELATLSSRLLSASDSLNQATSQFKL